MTTYTELRKHYLTEWQIWYKMCRRCRENERYYTETTVCDAWQGPQGFVEWFNELGPRPSKGSVLDRINKLGDYEPGNVEWTSKTQSQSRQRRHTNKLESAYWLKKAKENNIRSTTYYARIRDYGWSMQDAATLPPSMEKYATRILG